MGCPGRGRLGKIRQGVRTSWRESEASRGAADPWEVAVRRAVTASAVAVIWQPSCFGAEAAGVRELEGVLEGCSIGRSRPAAGWREPKRGNSRAARV
jgi:hypothetical protein